MLFGAGVELGRNPCTTAQLAPAATAAASLLPSEVGKNLSAQLRRLPFAQFSISPQQIKSRNPLTSLFSTYYSLFPYLPYPIPPAIPGAIPRTIPGAIPGAIRRAIPRAIPGAIPGTAGRAIPRIIPRAIRKAAGRTTPRVVPRIAGKIARRVIRRAIPRTTGRTIPRAIRRAMGRITGRAIRGTSIPARSAAHQRTTVYFSFTTLARRPGPASTT